jgi:predicted secreted protein
VISACADLLPPTPAEIIIDGDHAPASTTLAKGSRLSVRLKATLGSGFRWDVEQLAAGALTYVGTTIEHTPNASPGITGGADIQVFSFRADAVGQANLVFDYRRPWLKDEPPKETRKFVITITP